MTGASIMGEVFGNSLKETEKKKEKTGDLDLKDLIIFPFFSALAISNNLKLKFNTTRNRVLQ